jgi:hypothetical protein
LWVGSGRGLGGGSKEGDDAFQLVFAVGFFGDAIIFLPRNDGRRNSATPHV